MMTHPGGEDPWLHRHHTATTHCPAFQAPPRHRGHHHPPPPSRDARITFETLVKLHCRGEEREAAEACTSTADASQAWERDVMRPAGQSEARH